MLYGYYMYMRLYCIYINKIISVAWHANNQTSKKKQQQNVIYVIKLKYSTSKITESLKPTTTTVHNNGLLIYTVHQNQKH